MGKYQQSSGPEAEWVRSALHAIDWPQASATLSDRILQALDDPMTSDQERDVPPAYMLGARSSGVFGAPRWFTSLLLAGFVTGAAIAGVIPMSSDATRGDALLAVSPYYAGAGTVMLAQMMEHQ